MSGPEFMQIIHTILAHGDISDIAFNEKILGTKLNLSSRPEGYQSEDIFDAPIKVGLFRPNQLMFGGSLTFSGVDFFRDCLDIPLSSFYSSYGPPFRFVGPNIGMYSAPPEDGAVTALGAQWRFPGKNGGELILGVAFMGPYLGSVPATTAVDHVVITQKAAQPNRN